MTHWKNKKLDNLSDFELRQALNESISAQFQNNSYSKQQDITSTFIFGILTGAILTALAIYASISLGSGLIMNSP